MKYPTIHQLKYPGIEAVKYLEWSRPQAYISIVSISPIVMIREAIW